jgi:class 3 adenylate cyclase
MIHTVCPSARAQVVGGVVTFLFTDVEGSTRRWEADADTMRAALAVHDEVLRSAIEANGGVNVQAHQCMYELCALGAMPGQLVRILPGAPL